MLRLMLNNHCRLAVPFETGFPRLMPFAESLGDLSIRDNQRKLAEALAEEQFTKKGQVIRNIDAILAHEIRDFGTFIDAVFSEWAKGQGKPRWGVKTPGFVKLMDSLLQHFPSAQFIHIVRDGRDVVMSMGRVSWGTRNLLRAAESWKYLTILGRKMGRVMGPGRYHELRYEDLVNDPEGNLRGICKFLGEEFDPAMLSYHEGAKSEMPESSIDWHKSSVSAPNKNKVFAWKREMPISDQIVFDRYAGDVLEQFGYERVRRRHTLLSKLKQAYYAVT